MAVIIGQILGLICRPQVCIHITKSGRVKLHYLGHYLHTISDAKSTAE